MSENNIFETLDFVDSRFSFEVVKVFRSLPQFSYEKKILRNMKQMISCSLFKEFVFSHLLAGEKSKSKELREETSWIYKFIFKSVVSIYEATLCKQQRELLKS